METGCVGGSCVEVVGGEGEEGEGGAREAAEGLLATAEEKETGERFQ